LVLQHSQNKKRLFAALLERKKDGGVRKGSRKEDVPEPIADFTCKFIDVDVNVSDLRVVLDQLDAPYIDGLPYPVAAYNYLAPVINGLQAAAQGEIENFDCASKQLINSTFI
jgi:hypothetical protein